MHKMIRLGLPLLMLAGVFASPAAPDAPKEPTTDSPDIAAIPVKRTTPKVVVLIRAADPAQVTLTEFADKDLEKLLHHTRLLHPGTVIEVKTTQPEIGEIEAPRVERLNRLVKRQETPPRIDVSFSNDGKPLVDGVEFSLEQLFVMFSSIFKQQPAVRLVLVGPRDLVFKHSRSVIGCAARAGINEAIFDIVEWRKETK